MRFSIQNLLWHYQFCNHYYYFSWNQKYRRARTLEATRRGSTNSTSRIDSMARILFPLSFGLFNLTYWYSYFHAQKPFDWDDHMLKGKSGIFFVHFSAMYSSWGLLSKFFQNLRTAKKKANYRGLKESAIFCYVLIFLFFSWKSLSSIFDPKIHMGKNTYFSMRFILMMYENTAKSLSFVKTKKNPTI